MVKDRIATLGPMTGEAVGVVLKEVVRRALTTVRAQRISYEIHDKRGLDGRDDLFTTADTAAQRVVLKLIRECLPNVGILAEEEAYREEPTNGCKAYVTIDPIDGTRAFVRGQSHGIGSMIALVEGGDVLSAWIGDVNTQEIYGYRPGSTKTHRISEFNTSQHLRPQMTKIEKSYLLLRDPPTEYELFSQKLIPMFKNIEISGGSIGIWFARLWKQEVGALLVPSGLETPWDSAPVIGISQHLGYAFLEPHGDTWRRYDPVVPLSPQRRDRDMLVIHESMVDQITARGDIAA